MRYRNFQVLNPANIAYAAGLTACCLFCLFASLPVLAQEADAYFARIVTGKPGEVIEQGVMVVQAGKIVAVGAADEIDVPENVQQHRLHGLTIMPGIVVAQTGLIDQRDIEQTISPRVMAIDGFDFQADRSRLLASGITTIQVSPGGNRLVPGVAAVVKLAGFDEDEVDSRIVASRESLRIILDSSSRNAPSIFEPPVGPVSVERPLEPTRPQVSRTLSGSLTALRTIFKQALSDQTFVSTELDELSEAIADYFLESRVVRMSARTEAEARGALDLASEFDLELILVDCAIPQLADLIRERQAASNPPKIRGLVFSVPKPGGIGNVTADGLQQARELKAMVQSLQREWPVAFTTGSDADLRDLVYAVNVFTGSSDFSSLTFHAASILGVGDRVGCLSAGQDADFVVVNTAVGVGQQLPLMTYVNGNKVFERTPPQPTTVIRASRVFTGDGEVLHNSSLVVKGSTIRNVAESASAPLDAVQLDFGDAVVVPGFVDLGCSLGTGSGITGNIGLNTEIGGQLYADDPAIKLAREHGVTTALIGSLNANQPTPLVAIKLGDDPRVIKEPAAIRFVIGANVATSTTTIRGILTRGKQYADSWIKYEQDLNEYQIKKAELAKQAAEQKKEGDSTATESKENEQPDRTETPPGTGGADSVGRRGLGGRPPIGRPERTDPSPDAVKNDEQNPDASDEKKDSPAETDDAKNEKPESEEKKLEPPKEPQKRPELEPYRTLFAGDIPAFVEARTPDAIEAALKLFRQEFGVNMVLCGADGLARFPELLNDKQVAVVAGPDLVVDLRSPQQPDRRVNLVEVLVNEQIRIGFQSKATSGVAQLPSAVGFAVNQGLGVNDGLRALTHSPAEILAKGLTFGSLKPGNDADLVVLSGLPFDPGTEVLAVMIDGNWVFRREEK
ncbi:MAG TPA: amidohydrolase family protein [Pirellulaceae bacterium]|nr:amidohydrolase family protein [Pirellulaceae bacterium]HMO92312.1 amidohydrolase family protein [Pirellulaceae bacterium]HMP69236.1 amidohydrolase family protein [Pirellulaceae bacterium]